MVEDTQNLSPDEPIADGGNRPHKQVKAVNDDDGYLKSLVVKRSLVVGGHKTSVSLEDVFWNELRAISHERDVHLSQLVGEIDSERPHSNLSSAIRLFVFENRCNLTGRAQLQNEPQNKNPQTSPTPTSEKRRLRYTKPPKARRLIVKSAQS